MNNIPDLPVELCPHLNALVKAMKPLKISLSDGYSDWFECEKHNQGIRLGYDGQIEDISSGDATFSRTIDTPGERPIWEMKYTLPS